MGIGRLLGVSVVFGRLILGVDVWWGDGCVVVFRRVGEVVRGVVVVWLPFLCGFAR